MLAGAFGGPLEADQAADVGVVAGVGGVGALGREEAIEAVLGEVEGAVGHREAQAAQPRGADRDQEGGDRLPTLSEVVEALEDEIAARQALEVVLEVLCLCPRANGGIVAGSALDRAAATPGARARAFRPRYSSGP